jgi:hypothetical protein
MSIRNARRGRGIRNLPISLPFTLSPSLRIAQLSPGPKFADLSPLVLKRWSDLLAFAPNIVIGSLSEFRRLEDQATLGSLDTSSIDRAIIVLTRFGSNPLTDVSRVSLWQSFGVPIFELYLGLDQSLLASECEAHEGWHLAPGVRSLTHEGGELILEGAGNSGLRTGLCATVDQHACPCGLKTPRVLDVEHPRRFDGSFLAVTA